MHPNIAHVLRYFRFDHLPPRAREISETFHELAHALALSIDGPEATVALRKLLESKDAAVRAAIVLDAAEREDPAEPPPELWSRASDSATGIPLDVEKATQFRRQCEDAGITRPVFRIEYHGDGSATLIATQVPDIDRRGMD